VFFGKLVPPTGDLAPPALLWDLAEAPSGLKYLGTYGCDVRYQLPGGAAKRLVCVRD